MLYCMVWNLAVTLCYQINHKQQTVMATQTATEIKFYVIAQSGKITISQEAGWFGSYDAQEVYETYKDALIAKEKLESETWYVSTTYGTTWMGRGTGRDDYSYSAYFTGTYSEVWQEYDRRRDEEWQNR